MHIEIMMIIAIIIVIIVVLKASLSNNIILSITQADSEIMNNGKRIRSIIYNILCIYIL